MIEIITPQFERENEFLVNPYLPKNDTEFYEILETSNINDLAEMGFGRWQLMNEIIAENLKRLVNKTIRVPCIDLTGAGKTHMEFNVGRKKDAPTELLEVDRMIMLFSKEWYNIIPNGFMVTGLFGETYEFERDVTDDDIRFGCLAYGVQKEMIK